MSKEWVPTSSYQHVLIAVQHATDWSLDSTEGTLKLLKYVFLSTNDNKTNISKTVFLLLSSNRHNC